MKGQKRLCKRFARLKLAERRSRFLKNERFFTFFKKSTKQRLQLRLQLHCALPGSARSSALWLIQPHSCSFFPCDFRFTKQKTQYLFFCAISCSFFNSQKTCMRSIIVDFLILNHFSGPGPPLRQLFITSRALQRRFGKLKRRFREHQRRFR